MSNRLFELQDAVETHVDEEEPDVMARSVRRARRPRPRATAKALAARRPLGYRVPGRLPLLAQSSPMGAWAAALTALVSWRDRTSTTIEETLAALGERWVDLAHRGDGLRMAEKPDLLAAAGLVCEPPMRYAPEDWERLLRTNGPLWITGEDRGGKLFSRRALIVVGIQGTGAQARVDVIDVATGRERRVALQAALRRVGGAVAKPRVQIVHTRQATPNPEPAAAPPATNGAAPPAAPATPPVASASAVALTQDPTTWHAFQDGVRWRLTATGVEVEGSGIERTSGNPTTITRIWESYSTEINAAASEFNLPCALIVATIATESGGRADAVREEPGFTSDAATPHRVSPGLMQTLISTARTALGNNAIDRAWLLVPLNSIRAGTAYISQQRGVTNLDPPLVAAAYNSGGLYHQTGADNRWKLRQYPIGTGHHVDRFVRFFNDAVAVLAAHATRPTMPYDDLLRMTLAPPSMIQSWSMTALVHGVEGARITDPFYRDAAEKHTITGRQHGRAQHLGIDVSLSNASGGGADDARRGLAAHAAVRASIPLAELAAVRAFDTASRTGFGLTATTGDATLRDARVLVQPWRPRIPAAGAGHDGDYGGVLGLACHYTYADNQVLTIYVEFLHLITDTYPPLDNAHQPLGDAYRALNKPSGFGPEMRDGRVMTAAELTTSPPPIVGYLGATEFPHLHLQAAAALGEHGYLRRPRIDPVVVVP